MPIDDTLVGKSFPPTPTHRVTTESVAAFNAAIGGDEAPGTANTVPPTYPIVVTFTALGDFLAAEQIELGRVIHGDQKFHYERPVAVGDELSATLSVTKVRSIGGNDIISTASDVTDVSGGVVCTASATIIHRGESA